MVEAWAWRLPIITYTLTCLNISLTAMFSASSHPSSWRKFWKLMTKRNSSAGCPKTICVICSRSWINYRMGPFWENQFFVFWGAPKNFFETPKPYTVLETSHFWGRGHTWISAIYHICRLWNSIKSDLP